MTKRVFSCFLICTCLMFSLLLLTETSNSAYAATKASPSINFSNCHHIVVHLNGKNPATTACSNNGKAVNVSGKSHPRTDVVDCGFTALELYTNANEDGDTVCFLGEGFVNLPQYCLPFFSGGCLPGKSWNDQASSYNAGCSSGTFYGDVNGNGPNQRFKPHEIGNFNGGTSPNGIPSLRNDILSSLRIDVNCGN